MKLLDKIRKKRLLRWIATHNIKREVYKYFYDTYDTEYLNKLTDIDMRLKSFIEQGGRLIYAYDKDIYQKVKELKRTHTKYLIVENEWETKLNYLISAITDYYITHCWYTVFLEEQFDCFIKEFINKGGRFLYCADIDIEEQVKQCQKHNIPYYITIQKGMLEYNENK